MAFPMIKLDPIIVDFLGGNVLAIYISLKILQGIAKLTPSTVDDKISTMLINLFNSIKGGKVKENGDK